MQQNFVGTYVHAHKKKHYCSIVSSYIRTVQLYFVAGNLIRIFWHMGEIHEVYTTRIVKNGHLNEWVDLPQWSTQFFAHAFVYLKFKKFLSEACVPSYPYLYKTHDIR